MQLTYKFRLRDTCASELNRQARAVNFVWNYCNERQKEAVNKGRRWLSKYDLQSLTAGASKYLDIHAHTIQGVCHKYVDATSRRPQGAVMTKEQVEALRALADDRSNFEETKTSARWKQYREATNPEAIRALCDLALKAIGASSAEGACQVAIPEGLHPETTKHLLAFCGAMAGKLRKAEQKYGYSDGWLRDDWQQECLENMHEHIAKGDPRDVANYCMFMWVHGWPTKISPREESAEQARKSLLEQREDLIDKLRKATSSPAVGARKEGAELEVERDAGRYRWLRDSSVGQYDHPIAVTQERTQTGMLYVGPVNSSTPVITAKHYAHLLNDHLREAVATLDGEIAGKKKPARKRAVKRK
jgi:hypothetical protein